MIVMMTIAIIVMTHSVINVMNDHYENNSI